VLGPDGISDFDALHGGKRDADVRLYAFDLLADDGMDMRAIRLSGVRPKGRRDQAGLGLGYAPRLLRLTPPARKNATRW
jgi:hypothetical protein